MTVESAGKRGRPRDEALRTQRRNEILDAAAVMFAERGFPHTDVQAVADHLAIAKGTIYLYFPNKRALFLAAADRAMDRLGLAVEQVASLAPTPLERLAWAIHAYLAYFDEHPYLVELLIQERAEFKDRSKPTYFEHCDRDIGPWRQLLDGLIADGQIRDVPVGRIVNVMSDLLYGTMFTNHFTGRKKSVDEQYLDILDVVFRGVLTDRATGVAWTIPPALPKTLD
jgi:AcrR family transcriptional regulator